MIIVCALCTFLFQRNQFVKRIEETKFEELSGIAGLCIDDNYIYYSCTEIGGSNKVFLRKCEHNGTFLYDTSMPGNFIRGIGKDDNGYLYVLCSATMSKVVKFDEKLNPVRKTSSSCGKYFGVAYGILVTPEYVFVCARLNQKICILNLDLKLMYCLKVDFNPIGIANLHNKYFVLARGAIGVMEINFEQEKFEIKKYENNVKSDGKAEYFKLRVEFRGICADDKYLYVTERDYLTGGRVLCLDFDGKEFILKYFLQNSCKDCTQNCSPIVIAQNKGTIIYSQGSWFGGNFHLLRLKYDGTTATSETFIDV